MTLRVLFAFLFALTSAGVAWAGGADSLKLAVCQANFDRFAAAYPQERVYLHFDNTSYYKGERIWYKAYVVGGSDFRAAPLSRILYVELLTPMGYPVETQKLPLRGGQADGSFELSDTINAGFYEVRAYTAWMLNFTPATAMGGAACAAAIRAYTTVSVSNAISTAMPVCSVGCSPYTSR